MVNGKNIVGVVTSDNPEELANVQQGLANAPQRPMFLPGLPMMQQMQQPTNQVQFPILFFLFPRITMLLMTRMGQGQRGMGVRYITELVRDAQGRVTQIIEFTK